MKYTLKTTDANGHPLTAPIDSARREGALRCDEHLRAVLRGEEHLLFDGGMGTMLQAAGMKAGALPELLNFSDPDVITGIQRQYVEAGCDVITSNTFGANAHKLNGAASVEAVFASAVACARAAGARYVAGDIGPIGALLRPLGTMSFDEAYLLFKEEVEAGVKAGVDLFIIETMTDLAETKAAVLAAKENSDLPIFSTMTFEEDGRTFLGTSPEIAAITLDALGADVVGINCSQGPADLRPFAKRMLDVTDKPVLVQANAGLPHVDDEGNTVFDIAAPEYAHAVAEMIEDGVGVVGGCCGTTPDHMRLLKQLIEERTPQLRHHDPSMYVTSAQSCVTLPVAGHRIAVIGERINPTGKKRFQQALREGDMNYVLEQAVSQAEAGAQILDVNVGAPGVDEPVLMEQVVKALQSVTSLPLQLDSSNVEALARGLRVYNGKPIVNSTNGEPEKLAAILPLCKKYGAAIVGLAIDEKGIQPKAADRVAIARRITEAALAAGIPREDIYIDCLTLTASAQQEDVLATVQALEACKKELGVRTVLGVSNISFGLPCRTYLNTTFLTMAMYAGLDLAIMNPSSEEMMAAVYAYNVLTNRDKQSTKYIERFADRVPASTALAQAAKAVPAASAAEAELTGPYAALMKAVEKGLKGDAAAHTRALLAEKQPLEVVDEALIPALDIVGAKYEKGTLFLPQLLQAASAAQSAFEEIKTAIAQKGEGSASKGRIVLATVKGDVHDIGKNIVRVILENYGFEVLDLGRDVPVETVVDTVREKDVHLVGLSALMTTTLKSMEETIAALHAAKLDCKIMVGGAVLTPEYAEKIGADWYAKDAKRSADIAKEFFGV